MPAHPTVAIVTAASAPRRRSIGSPPSSFRCASGASNWAERRRTAEHARRRLPLACSVTRLPPMRRILPLAALAIAGCFDTSYHLVAPGDEHRQLVSTEVPPASWKAVTFDD